PACRMAGVIELRFNQLNTRMEQSDTDYCFIDIRNKSGKRQWQVAGDRWQRRYEIINE
ncbi:MAG: hypothetical protein PWP52_2013, partial [Bacteroidales bacterium]|nr:hypothetical protein [Bacteroidales bacterium]